MKVTPYTLMDAIGAADERVIEKTAPELYEQRPD